MNVLAVARSLAVGSGLGLLRTPAGRSEPLSFTPFEAALKAVGAQRLARVRELTAQASIAELGDLLAAGGCTATELALASLASIQRHDPVLRSILELNPEVLVEAGRSDGRRRAGAVLGPLEGIPLTVKDNIETGPGMHTTAGAQILADHVARADAPLVVSLRAAGAVILGKANLSELAGAVCRTPGVSAVGGATLNPYGAAFSPGGSSSGSAVAVAAGFCAGSVGTETAGSLIAPAAFNGVVGMKPSRGLVSTAGVVPLVRHQDSAGPLARCVVDAALLLATMATTGAQEGGVRFEPRLDALQGVPVGILRSDILAQRSRYENTSDNADVLERVIAGLASAGAKARDSELALPRLRAAFDAGFTRVVLGGLANDTMGYLAASGAPATSVAALQAYNLADARRRMPRGQYLLSLAVLMAPEAKAYERAALAQREQAEQILAATFAASDIEILASLSNLHSALYATAGYPAITVPLGLRATGMPVGVTLIGRPGTDGRLLGLAYAFEQATLLRVAPTL